MRKLYKFILFSKSPIAKRIPFRKALKRKVRPLFFDGRKKRALPLYLTGI